MHVGAAPPCPPHTLSKRELNSNRRGSLILFSEPHQTEDRFMFFGNTPFTFAHVIVSLVGIGSGFVVAYGLLAARRLDGWTALFLASNIATSVSGLFLQSER